MFNRFWRSRESDTQLSKRTHEVDGTTRSKDNKITKTAFFTTLPSKRRDSEVGEDTRRRWALYRIWLAGYRSTAPHGRKSHSSFWWEIEREGHCRGKSGRPKADVFPCFESWHDSGPKERQWHMDTAEYMKESPSLIWQHPEEVVGHCHRRHSTFYTDSRVQITPPLQSIVSGSAGRSPLG